MMTKKHTSKTSYGLLIFIFIIIFAPIIPILSSGEMNKEVAGKLLFMITLLVFILHIFLQTTYTIDEGKLKIKSGVLAYRPISISEITEISKTKSLYSSPAPSFDRIVVKYGAANKVIVSPKDKVAFAKDLCEVNSNILNLITED